MTLEIASTSLENTLEIAEKVGRRLKGGEVIELISDVGGGKTTFVRGLAKGIESTDQVASPTFTISREYRGAEVEIHHFDFYRLDEPGVVRAELAESIADSKVIVAIEWADIVHGVLPEDRLSIKLLSNAEDENSRTFTMSAGSGHEHLLEDMR